MLAILAIAMEEEVVVVFDSEKIADVGVAKVITSVAVLVVVAVAAERWKKGMLV